MKLWCPIVILLVCFVACKNSSLKQREIMSPSVQDTLKDSRYDSVVYFDERPYDVPGNPRDGRKYYLRKDSLFFRGKDTFYCREYHSYFFPRGNTKRRIFYEKSTKSEKVDPFMEYWYHDNGKISDKIDYFTRRDSIIYDIDTVKCRELHIVYDENGHMIARGCQGIAENEDINTGMNVGTWSYYKEGKLVKEEYYHNGSFGKDYIIHFLYKSKYTREIIVTNNFQLYQNDSVVLYPKKIRGKLSNKGGFFDILISTKRRKQFKDNQVLLLTKKSAPYEESSGDYEECKGWSIPEKTIKYVMKHSKPMDSSELHDMFDVYPCVVEGVLIYKGEPYFYRVNAGGWWELIQGEKYLMMGYYGDDAIKRGFIDGVYDWSSQK